MIDPLMEDRLPPHDIPAEESVLGSLLLDELAIRKVLSFLSPDDFYRERNRWVYEACLNIDKRNDPTDQVSVAHELDRTKHLEDVGGAAYLSHLVAVVPTSVHIVHYAEIVRDTGEQRRFIRAAGQLAQNAYNRVPSSELAQGMVNHGLSVLESRRSRGRLRKVSEAVREHMPAALENFNTGFRKRGVPSGFGSLDFMLGGFEPGKLYVVGARTSMGKTMFALTLAGNVARQQRPVALFSNEQGEESMLTRMVVAKLGQDPRSMTAQQRDSMEGRFIDAFGEVGDLPLWLTDGTSLTTSDIHIDALACHARHGLKLICVDFLTGLADRPFGGSDRRVDIVGRMARNLKNTAMELKVPVVVAAQLNRGTEIRAGKKPELSDLRDSGEIEQVADAVLLLYRKGYYGETEAERTDTTLEINIAKNRDGPTGTVKIYYNPATGQMGDFTRGLLTT